MDNCGCMLCICLYKKAYRRNYKGLLVAILAFLFFSFLPVFARAPTLLLEIPEKILIERNALYPIYNFTGYRKIIGTITMYNPVQQQTDSTPYITASGNQEKRFQEE